MNLKPGIARLFFDQAFFDQIWLSKVFFRKSVRLARAMAVSSTKPKQDFLP